MTGGSVESTIKHSCCITTQFCGIILNCGVILHYLLNTCEYHSFITASQGVIYFYLVFSDSSCLDRYVIHNNEGLFGSDVEAP